MKNYDIDVRCKALHRTQTELCRLIREQNPYDPTLSRVTPPALSASIRGNYSPLASAKILSSANHIVSRWEYEVKEGT